jgi:hypothetical protein
MTESLSLEELEQFAANVSHAIKTGQLPQENVERIALALCGMVTTLVADAKEHRDLCPMEREALAVILYHANLKFVSHVM